MSIHPTPGAPSSRGPWQQREEVIDRFEKAWRDEERPEIDAYRALGGADLLPELARTDLELRLKAGEAARAEEYLARYPELAEGAQFVLDLAATEYELRRRREPDLPPDEYGLRFPQWRELLLDRLRALAPERPVTAVAVPGYEVLRELGRGGMGVVYLARQLSLGRLVALKMILAAHAGPQATARLRREAESAARLQHPNIVQVYEVGEHDGQPFLALEHIEGGNLAQRFARAPLSPRQAAELVEVLARAVHHAHERGVVHRDLKPANILLAGDGTPKVSDFGLAKQIEEGARYTHSGAVLGTPAYMAPEQAAGRAREVGPLADVYALGALLYESLTGRAPFHAETPLATLQQVLHGELPAPSQLRHGVPRDLETVCLKCLHKQPARRYASAGGLADDLRRFLTGEPVHARPVGPTERLLKWARRRPAAAALLALGLLLGVGFSLYWQSARELRHSRELRAEQQQRAAEALESQRDMRQYQYAADVARASQFWRNGEVGPAHDILARLRPDGGEEGPPGFAWHFLWRQCSRERSQTPLPGHPRGLTCAAFSPDGAALATAGAAGEILLWDRRTWRRRATLPGHVGALHGLAFSADGSTLASVGADQTVRAWDAVTGRERRSFRAQAQNVALSPDGRWLAFSQHWDLRVWDLDRDRERPLQKGQGGAVSVAFTPDSKTLASASLDGAIRLWNVPAGSLRATWPHRAPAVLAFSGDGQRLAVSDVNGTVVFWDVPLGKRLPAVAAHRGAVRALTFTPNGQGLASAGSDGSVRLWDLEAPKARLVLRGHGKAVLALAADGRSLTSVGEDGTARRWDIGLAPRGEPLAPALRPSGPFAFSPDGKALALAESGYTVKVVDVATGRVRATLRGPRGPLRALAYSPDGQALATVGEDRAVRLWCAATGQERGALVGHEDTVTCVAFSADGRSLATGSADRTVRLWDVASRKARGVLPGHPGAVNCLAFAPDGHALVSGCAAGVVTVWDAAGARATARHATGREVFAVAFSPAGRAFATGHTLATVKLWEAPSGASVADLIVPVHDAATNGPQVRSLAFSPDGRTLAAEGSNGTMSFWDVATRALRQELCCNAPIQCVRFSPQGGALAVTTNDGRLRLWAWPGWEPRQPFSQPFVPVRALAFSQDGRALVTGSMGGMTRLRTFRHRVSWDRALTEGGDDVRLWDAVSGQERPGLPGQHTFGAERLGLAPAGDTLVVGSRAGVVGLWDVKARKGRIVLAAHAESLKEWRRWSLARRWQLPLWPRFPDAAWGLALSPDGRLLAVAGESVKLYELPAGRECGSLPATGGASPALAFSPDGKTLAGGREGNVHLWDVPARKLRQVLPGHREGAWSLAFSPDGQLLASGGKDWQVKLWDLSTGRERAALLGHTDVVSSLAFTPDGKELASASWDGTVRLWHLRTGQELLALEAHRGRAHCLAFSPDGQALATGGETPEGGGEVYLWRSGP